MYHNNKCHDNINQINDVYSSVDRNSKFFTNLFFLEKIENI